MNPFGGPVGVRKLQLQHARELANATDDGKTLRAFLLAIFNDATAPLDARIWAWTQIKEGMMGKTPIALEVESREAPSGFDLTKLTLEELEQLDAMHAKAAGLPDPAMSRAHALPGEVIDVESFEHESIDSASNNQAVSDVPSSEGTP